jgi:hypothetical protein
MSHEITETKEEKALKRLMRELGIFNTDLKKMLLLGRAIEYADLDLYTEEENIRHTNEYINNQIFSIKAQSYYNLKRLPYNEDYPRLAKQIQDYEHREVMFLKAKLLH